MTQIQPVYAEQAKLAAMADPAAVVVAGRYEKVANWKGSTLSLLARLSEDQHKARWKYAHGGWQR